jgi:hypothetical protein
VITTFSELFIPARSLPYGIYELKLVVTMIELPAMKSFAVTYVMIIPSSIIVNFVKFGTSMITRGHQQDFTLDPGTFSIDPDTTAFNTVVSSNAVQYSFFHKLSYS